MRIGYKNFFSSSNYSGVCGACSWGVKTLPRSPSSRGAVEMFCLVEPQGCRKALFVDVGPIWSSLFSDLCALRSTIAFGAQLRSRPTKSLAYDSRFSNYVSRYRGVAEEKLDQNAMRGQVTLVTPKGFASESARREMSLKARSSRVPALTS